MTATDTRAAGSPLFALRAERDRFVALAFCWADLLLELDASAKVVYAAGAFEALTGRRTGKLIGQQLHTLIAHQDRARIADLLTIACKRGRIENARVRLLSPKGSTPPLTLAGYRLDDLSGHYFLALHIGETPRGDDGTAPTVRDKDTGLYDIRSFIERVTRPAATDRGEAERRMSLIVLSGYDGLRERLAESAEQELLSTVGACLRASSLDGETAGRLSNDRYGLVHAPELDVALLEQRIAKLTRQADPTAQGIAVQSATVNVDTDPAGDRDIASVLVYTINRFCTFQGSDFTLRSLSTSISALAREAIEDTNHFRRIVTSASFDVVFQPIVNAQTGNIHHYEALARFPSTFGQHTPRECIALAEHTGLIANFDLAMAQKVMDWLAGIASFNADTGVAVNVSGVSVGSASYLAGLAGLDDLLKENAWARGRLMFEITESARMSDLDAANAFIQRLRKRGYAVCLDDFGAGAANFHYLASLEVDIVKLDGSSLRTAQKAHKGRAFLKAFVALCRELGIAVVAEMVEDEAGLDFVRTCGVEYAQGYLFGKPCKDISVFTKTIPARLFPRLRTS